MPTHGQRGVPSILRKSRYPATGADVSELPPIVRPVPPAFVVGIDVVLLTASVYARATSCSILSCAYSAARAERCPSFSVIAVANEMTDINPHITVNRMPA